MTTAKQIWRIEDPRGHTEAALAGLRRLLADGAPMNPDPKRAHFYEIADQTTVYWIHILPGRRTTVLLAAWPATAGDAAKPAASASARPVVCAPPSHAPYEPARVEA